MTTPAVMRCVRAAPVNPSTLVEEPPAPLTHAEKAAAIRAMAAMLGVENARRRDREAAARKAAAGLPAADRITVHPAKPSSSAPVHSNTTTTCKPTKETTAMPKAARTDAVPPPPRILDVIRELRGTDDTQPARKAAAEPHGVPAPPSFRDAIRASRRGAA